MKLGKLFCRLKRRINTNAMIIFTRDDGTQIRPHRKLNMMLVLSIRGGINKKALEKEIEKMHKKVNRLEKESGDVL